MKAQSKNHPSGEFNVGFSFLADSNRTGYGFQSGIHAAANKWFGVEAQFNAWPAVSDTDMDFYATVGGPRFSMRWKKVAPYAHFLVGGVFSRMAGITESQFALQTGGGIQIFLSRRFAWQLEGNDVFLPGPEKHYFHFSAGMVYRWY